MSKFSQMRNNARSKLGLDPLKDKAAADAAADDEESVADDEAEFHLQTYLEMGRNLFIQHQLNGSLEVSRQLGPVSRSVGMEVEDVAGMGTAEAAAMLDTLSTEDDSDTTAPAAAAAAAAATAAASDAQNPTRMQKMVLKVMEQLIKQLMKRARKYKDKDYKEALELSSEMGVSGPMFGLVSVGVSMSASVENLEAAYEHTLKHKAAAK
jgi:hypothetical protein